MTWHIWINLYLVNVVKSLAQEGFAQGEEQVDMVGTLNSLKIKYMALQFKKSIQVARLQFLFET